MREIKPDLSALTEFDRQSRIRELEAELAQLRGEEFGRNRAERRANHRRRRER